MRQLAYSPRLRALLLPALCGATLFAVSGSAAGPGSLLHGQPLAPAASDDPGEPAPRRGGYEHPIARDYFDRALRAFGEARQTERRLQAEGLRPAERERLESSRREQLLEGIRLLQRILGDRELREGVLYRHDVGRYVGTASAVREMLIEEGELALSLYRDSVDAEARAAVRAAMANADANQLIDVVVSYPFATASLPAGIQAARVLWERGELDRAAALCRRLLERTDLTNEHGALLLSIAAYAYAMQGRAYEAGELVAVAETRFAEATAAVGRRTVPVTQVVRERHREALDQAGGNPEALGWHTQSGDPTNRNEGHGSIEPTNLKWRAGYPNPTRTGASDTYRPGYPGFGLPRRFPVADESILVVPNRTGAMVYNLFDGRRLWSYEVPTRPRQGHAFGPRTGEFWLDEYSNRDHASIDTATIAGDEVYVPIEMPMDYERHDPNGVGGNRGQNQLWGNTIILHAPRRRLYSFDARTGAVRWKVGAEWEDRQLPIHRTLSYTTAPVVLGDRVYASAAKVLDQNAHVFVAAFDREPVERGGDAPEPRVVWLTKLASGLQETNLFGRPTREPVPSGLAYQSHRLFVSTNIGSVSALDTLTGEQVWTFPYERIPFVPPVDVRNHFRDVTWFNMPPIVHDGVVFVAPMDSAHLYALDAETGEKLWSQPWSHPRMRVERPRHLVGVHRNHVYWCGQRYLFRTNVDGRSPVEVFDLSGSPMGRISGRPIIVDGFLYAPTTSNEIRMFDLARGRTVRTIVGGAASIGGNLLLSNGVLVAANEGHFGVAYDWESLIDDLQQRERNNPNDPRIKLRIADISRQRGAAGRATAMRYYERVLELTDGVAGSDANQANTQAHRGLLALWMETYEQARAAGDMRRQQEAIRMAGAHVRDPADGISLMLLRLEHARRHNPREALAIFEEMREQYGAIEYEFTGYGRTTAERFAVLEAAKVAESLGRHALAIELWQRALERFARAPLGSETTGEVARLRIAALIETAGREAYAPIEARAEQALAEARQRRSVSGLQGVATRFPNSRSAAEALVLRARWGLAAAQNGDPADLPDVVEALQVVRDHHADSPRRPEALLLLGRAYMLRDMLHAARGAFRQARRDHGERTVELDGESVRVDEYVDRMLRQPELAGLVGDTPLPRLSAVPLRLRHEQDFGDGQRIRLIRPIGQAGGFSDHVYMIVNRRFTARNARNGQFLWDLPDVLTEYATAFIGERLAIVGANGLHLIDPATGEQIAHTNLGYSVQQAAMREGMAAVVLFEQTNAGNRFRLAVVNAESGEVIGELSEPLPEVITVREPIFVGEHVLLPAHTRGGMHLFGYRLDNARTPTFHLDEFAAAPRGSPQVIDDERFALMLGDGTIQVRSVVTGGVLQTHAGNRPPAHNGLWTLPDAIVYADLRGGLYAVNVVDDEPLSSRWDLNFGLGDRVSTASILSTDTFYSVRTVSAERNINLAAHDMATGEVLWDRAFVVGESNSYHVRDVLLTQDQVLVLIRQFNDPSQRNQQRLILFDRGSGQIEQTIEFVLHGPSLVSTVVVDDNVHIAYDNTLRTYAPGD